MIQPEIRRCCAEDVAAIAAHEPPGSSYAETTFAAQEAGRCLYLVAWLGDEALGSGELEWGRVPALKNLNIRTRFRGKGVGSLITSVAETHAEQHGAISLAVGTENPDARRLYERLGYLSTGRFETYSYEFINADGTAQSATETVEHLVKRLR